MGHDEIIRRGRRLGCLAFKKKVGTFGPHLRLRFLTCYLNKTSLVSILCFVSKGLVAVHKAD